MNYSIKTQNATKKTDIQSPVFVRLVVVGNGYLRLISDMGSRNYFPNPAQGSEGDILMLVTISKPVVESLKKFEDEVRRGEHPRRRVILTEDGSIEVDSWYGEFEIVIWKDGEPGREFVATFPGRLISYQ